MDESSVRCEECGDVIPEEQLYELQVPYRDPLAYTRDAEFAVFFCSRRCLVRWLSLTSS